MPTYRKVLRDVTAAAHASLHPVLYIHVHFAATILRHLPARVVKKLHIHTRDLQLLESHEILLVEEENYDKNEKKRMKTNKKCIKGKKRKLTMDAEIPRHRQSLYYTYM